ncbi:phosphotransferase [Blastococcus capsensis]|uniref:phosphotransferase n=1 Tax=Blastococcus capsensis TaxID=1564163 RepID=UPI002542239B|nr:phosphotransferase [Blastococcus capsensis]MDK3255747.1 phosphotransferase [Blastococcus capsensis]
MTTATALATPPGEALRAAVARRSPRVVEALDPGHALARARAWAARSVPDATVEAVRVRSVRYHPDGGCTLRYLVQLSSAGPERLLLVRVPASGTGIAVRPFPADPDLPTLRHALDPLLMREVLGRVVPGTGGARAIGRCEVDVVRYPREERCVLRYRLSPGAGGAGELHHPVVFGKVYGDSSAATTAAGLRVLRAGLRVLPGPLRVVVPQPLAVVPSLRLGLTEAIPGRPVLPDLLRRACEAGPGADRRLQEAVAAAARAAAAVHACDSWGTRLPVRDLAVERALAERDLTALDPVWPGVAAYLRRRVVGALEAVAGNGSATGWPVVPVLAHGDLTPGQVLLDDSGRAGIVDVDTLCVAEPALDLGRFLAYLHVAGIRRSPAAWPLLADLTGIFLTTYLDVQAPSAGAGNVAVDARRLLLARTAAYRVLALARLGASACRQLKDDRLGAATDVLDAGNDWMRSVAV